MGKKLRREKPSRRRQSETTVKPFHTNNRTSNSIIMSVSRGRQNFHTNSEALINKQINMELHASYVYMAMYTHFSRDDVALHGFAKMFKKNSEEEREHAFKLVHYQDVNNPAKNEWESALEAVEGALDLEKRVNQSLL